MDNKEVEVIMKNIDNTLCLNKLIGITINTINPNFNDIELLHFTTNICKIYKRKDVCKRIIGFIKLLPFNYINIHHDVLRKELGGGYNKIINILIMNNLIVKYDGYVPGKQSCMYKLHPDFIMNSNIEFKYTEEI